MDFESMKRRDLQALCKKHGLPANTTNSRMIDGLSSILQEKMMPKGCLKGSGGSSAEDLGVIGGGSKKVTFTFEDEDADADEEIGTNTVGKSKRKSSKTRKIEKGRKEIDKVSHYVSPKNVAGVTRRATRSCGLAEFIVWSPVIEKKKNGAEGVRRNAKPSMDTDENAIIAEVPSTRSLRNRVVAVTDKTKRNIQKRKNSDQDEKKEKMDALLKEDDAVGKKNLRKRSREGETVKDEPPSRRSTRNHEMLDEIVATEEVDVGRSKKRRRGGVEALSDERVLNEETQMVLKHGGTAKRSRGNTLNSNAMESVGVTGPTRRSTRSSSALSEAGNSASAVGKADQEGKAVRINKSEKQAKRVDSAATLLVDSEVVAEPMRRSTHSSSTLLGNSIKGCEPVQKGKSQKQVTLLTTNEVVALPVRRSTRSSSSVQEEVTTTISVGESTEGGEVVGKRRLQKQAREHGSKGGVSVLSSPVAEVVSEPVSRSTRHSSNLVEEGNSLPVVGKSTKGGEAARKGKSQKQEKDHGSTGVGPTASLPDNEVTVETVMRSTRSSSSLSENMTSPVVKNSVKEGEAAWKGKPIKQGKGHASEGEVSMSAFSGNEAIGDSTRRLTRSSSKMLENESPVPSVGKLGGDDEAIKDNKAVKQKRDYLIESGDSAASLPDSRAVITPTRRSTRGHGEAVRKDTSSKKPKQHIIEQGGSATSLLDNEAVTMPGRRSTRRSSKVPADSEVVKSPFSPHLDNEVIITPAKRPACHSLKVSADSEVVKSPCSSHPDNEASIMTARRSPSHSSKVPVDSEVLKSLCFPHLDDKAVTLPAGSSTCHLSKCHADSEVLNSPCTPHPTSCLLEDITESRVKAKSSRKELNNVEEGQVDMKKTFIGGTDSAEKISVPGCLDTVLTKVSNDVDPEVAAQMIQYPDGVPLERIEHDASLVGTLKDLDDVSLSSHVIEGHSSLMGVVNNIVNVSSEVQEDFSGKPGYSNVDAAVKTGALEFYGDDRDVASDPVEPASSTIDSRKASVGALDMDELASMESQNIISHPVPPTSSEEQSTSFHTKISTMAYLKAPDSMVELDPDHDDILTMHVMAPCLPCKSSDEPLLTSDADAYPGFASKEASCLPCKSSDEPLLTSDADAYPGFASKEPTLDLETCDAADVRVQGNEATYISRPALVGNSFEELLSTSDTDISPEIDPLEHELKVEVEGPMEDFMVSSGTDKSLMTSNSEVFSETFCENNNEESDSKVDVHNGNKGCMVGTKATNTAGSPLSCKSAGVLSPTFLPSLHNEIYPEIGISESDLTAHTQAMSKVASDFSINLNEASGTHSKTLEASLTSDMAAESFSIQRSFDDEVENCEVETCTILSAKLAPEEGDAGEKIEASIAGSELQSCSGLGVIKETWVSSIFPVNDDVETEGGKNGAEKNGDELRPSSPSENLACDLNAGDHVKEPGSPSTTAQLTLDECDASEKIEASIAGSESQSCIGLEVIKETWISSTSSVLVNEDAETEGDASGAEKIGDEPRSTSPRENPAYDLDTGDHMKEHGSPSTEETVDGTSTLSSRGDVKKSGFTLGWYNEDPADAEGNSRDSFDDEFCEDNSEHFQSSYAFMNPGVPSYVLPMESKDDESTHSQIYVASSEVIEGKSSVVHGSSIKTLVASGKSAKQLEKEDVLLVVNTESTEISALTNENRSPIDAVLVGGDTKAMDLPVSGTCDGEILHITTSVTPAPLGYKGSANKGNTQECPCVTGSEYLSHLSGQHEVSLTHSLGVDSADMCLKSSHKGQQASEQLIEVSDILRETVHTANELADVKHERFLELAAIHAEEMKNIESLEGMATIEDKDSTLKKKVDSIGHSSLDSFDGACEERDDAILFQEIEDLPVERHTCDVTRSSLHYSVLRLPKRNLVLSNEDQLTKENTEKASAEEENLNTEEFRCSDSSVLLAGLEESPVLDSGSWDAYNANNDNYAVLEDNSDCNSIIASTKKAESEHDLSHSFRMFISRMARDDDGLAGISENTEASPPEDHSLGLEKLVDLSSIERLATDFTTSSGKPHSQDGQSSKYRGSFECLGLALNVDESLVAPCVNLAFAEGLFHMDSEAANFVNDGAQAGRSGPHEQNLGHDRCGDRSDRNAADSIAVEDGERNAAVLSGRPDAKLQETCPYKCEISPKAESLSGSSAKPCADADDQAINLAGLSEDQEERRSIQKTLEVSQFRKEETSTVLDVMKIEDSATVLSKSERIESMPIPTVPYQEELITRNCIEPSVINVADQFASWDFKDSSAMDMSNGNELEDPEYMGTCSGQHVLTSLDSEAVGLNSAATQETMICMDETVAPKGNLEDLWLSFDDTDSDSSQDEADSTLENADHPSKSRNDASKEQNRSSDLKQTEDSKECIPSSPVQLTRNFDPYSVIDDAIRNKENTVGLKMGSTQKHNEKSAVSSSSRRPLQSVLRTKSDQ